MTEFVTLNCPTCGGKLDIGRSLSRLTCGFCGSEHLIFRDGATVSLRNAAIGKPSNEEFFENVHPNYHLTLKRILADYIQPDEDVLFAGEATRKVIGADDFPESCLIVITNFRWIKASMTNWLYSDYVAYKTVGSRLEAMIGLPFWQRLWVSPPNKLPKESQEGGEAFSHKVGEKIVEAQLKDLSKVRSKEYFTVESKGETLEFCEITTETSFLAFKKPDGDRVYTLLWLASRNDWQIPS